MGKLERGQLHALYSDVVRGYSRGTSEVFGRFFIKHFRSFDFSEIEAEKEKHLSHARRSGLKTITEAEEEAIKKGFWSPEKEKEISQTRIFVDNLILTKKKSVLKTQIDALNEEIKKTETKLKNLEAEKEEIIGYCADHFANKKITEFYIRISMFNDVEFREPVFSQETFESVNEKELEHLTVVYNHCTDKFNSNILKQVALTPAFLNGFYLCKNNPFSFYGKPIIELSTYQVELFGYGIYFKNIFADGKDSIPDDIRDDPEALVEWYDSHQNAEKILEKTKGREGGAVAIVGASAEDRKRLGLDGKTIDFSTEAQNTVGV